MLIQVQDQVSQYNTISGKKLWNSYLRLTSQIDPCPFRLTGSYPCTSKPLKRAAALLKTAPYRFLGVWIWNPGSTTLRPAEQTVKKGNPNTIIGPTIFRWYPRFKCSKLQFSRTKIRLLTYYTGFLSCLYLNREKDLRNRCNIYGSWALILALVLWAFFLRSVGLCYHPPRENM